MGTRPARRRARAVRRWSAQAFLRAQRAGRRTPDRVRTPERLRLPARGTLDRDTVVVLGDARGGRSRHALAYGGGRSPGRLGPRNARKRSSHCSKEHPVARRVSVSRECVLYAQSSSNDDELNLRESLLRVGHAVKATSTQSGPGGCPGERREGSPAGYGLRQLPRPHRRRDPGRVRRDRARAANVTALLGKRFATPRQRSAHPCPTRYWPSTRRPVRSTASVIGSQPSTN